MSLESLCPEVLSRIAHYLAPTVVYRDLSKVSSALREYVLGCPVQIYVVIRSDPGVDEGVWRIHHPEFLGAFVGHRQYAMTCCMSLRSKYIVCAHQWEDDVETYLKWHIREPFALRWTVHLAFLPGCDFERKVLFNRFFPHRVTHMTFASADQRQAHKLTRLANCNVRFLSLALQTWNASFDIPHRFPNLRNIALTCNATILQLALDSFPSVHLTIALLLDETPSAAQWSDMGRRLSKMRSVKFKKPLPMHLWRSLDPVVHIYKRSWRVLIRDWYDIFSFRQCNWGDGSLRCLRLHFEFDGLQHQGPLLGVHAMTLGLEFARKCPALRKLKLYGIGTDVMRFMLGLLEGILDQIPGFKEMYCNDCLVNVKE